jgi:hypothetical protein
MNFKEIISLQLDIKEEDITHPSLILFYIRERNSKERVEKVGILKEDSYDTISKIESLDGFVRWCSKKELEDIYKRFAKLMVGRG